MPEREELRRAVLGWLERVADNQDLSPALEPRALTDASRLAAVLRPGDDDLQSRNVLGWLYYYRGLGGRAHDLDAAIEILVPCFIAGEDGLPEDLLPLLVTDAIGPATALLGQAAAEGDPGLVRAAADLWGRIVNVLPVRDPCRPGLLASFGIAMRASYALTEDPADLEAAIAADLEAAVAAREAAGADAGLPEAARKQARASSGSAGGGRMWA
jgi:hypothetical protein